MKIIIPGNPFSKARHRCGCKGRFPYSYDPQVSKEMAVVKKYITSVFYNAMKSNTREIAIEACSLPKAASFNVRCVFGFMAPRSCSLGQKNALLWGLDHHNSKPDLDNLLKLYWDCGTGIIWRDDAQIVLQSSTKIYTENPFTEITVMASKEINMPENYTNVLKAISPTQFDHLIRDARFISKLEGADGQMICKQESLSYISKAILDFSKAHAKILTKIAKIND